MPVETPEVASPATATEPKAPAPVSGDSANPNSQTSDQFRAERRQAVKATLKAMKENRTPAPEAPSPEAPVTPVVAEHAAVPNPKEPVPANVAAKPEKSADPAPKSVKVQHGADKDGKPVEVEITLEQARRAILRDGYNVKGLSAQDILDTGSRRHLAQSDFDRSWNDARVERQRLADEIATLKSAPNSSANGPKPEVDATPPAAAKVPEAQPIPAPAMASAQNLLSAAELAAMEEQFGPSAAAVMLPILNRLRQNSTDNPFSAELAGLKTEIQNHQQQNAYLANMLVQREFDRGFDKLAKTFPQLEGEGGDALRKELQDDWNALARSGKHKDPYAPKAFESILREVAHGHFGDQLLETHALQLQGRQKLEKNGQIPSTESRSAAPAAALTDRERRKAVAMELLRTGDVRQAARKNQEILSQSG